jgi:hypothetical protein
VAFPFLLESNFESGSNAEWTSETDTVSQLDFPHYSELARYPWKTCVPFQGAYCARVVLSGGTADAFVSSTSTTIALDTNFVGFVSISGSLRRSQRPQMIRLQSVSFSLPVQL